MVKYYRGKFEEEKNLMNHYFKLYKDEYNETIAKEYFKQSMAHEKKAKSYMKKIVDLTYKKC